MKYTKLLLPVLAFTLASAPAQAAVVRLSWTAIHSTPPSAVPASYLAFGESYVVTLLVDNGGSSAASQTWTAANFIGLEAVSASGDTWFTSSAPNASTGVFATDASGNVTSVGNWRSNEAAVTTSQPYSGVGAWFLNGANDVLYGGPSGRFDSAWSASNVSSNRTPASWTAALGVVPEPGSAALGLAGVAGLVLRRRRSA